MPSTRHSAQSLARMCLIAFLVNDNDNDKARRQETAPAEYNEFTALPKRKRGRQAEKTTRTSSIVCLCA